MNSILWIFVVGLATFLLYGIVPTVLLRTRSIGLIKKGHQRDTIALTFDDGPNPHYTPQLLDLLKQYNCKATFFVVAEKVLNYPELVKRMVADGHDISIHHYTHTNSWFLTPWATKRELEKSAEILEKTTGVRPRFYRPPYGRFNVFTYRFAKEYSVVLWSSIFQDWKKQNPEQLMQQMVSQLGDGEIYLLHDDGANRKADTMAPESTIEALRSFIPEALRMGYKFKNLHEHLDTKSVQEQKRIL
jgi:peptidoglycan/xylan/chitin deacetylase (PgdA/CDA1 family)